MAANYTLTGDMEKRVRFFDGQFLQDQDFVDEQKYHLDRGRRHHRLLHVAGIADGLTVSPAGANRVTVAPGTAIDADGRQLVLAQPTTADLPAETFNNQRGVRIAIAYQESPVDRQAREGSADDTRWLERPEIVRLAANEPYSGPTPPVLLAEVALDNQGTVTVDPGVRQYSGVRLPGPAADPPLLRTTTDGRVGLTGSLVTSGNVGVGTASPDRRLTVSAPAEHLQLRRESTETTGGKQLFLELLQVDPDGQTVPEVRPSIRFHHYGKFWHRLEAGPDGFHCKYGYLPSDDYVGLKVGNLEVKGAGGTTVDLLVSGRLRSSSDNGGLWVAEDRFIGGHSTDQVGFYNNKAWRLTVLNNGNIGIGTTDPENAERWSRVVDVVGSGTTKLSLRTGSVDARVLAHDRGFWNAPAGMILGTSTPRHSLSFATEASARMTITPMGNIGIGTTGPVATLDVQQSPRTGRHPPEINGLYVTGDFGDAKNGVEFRLSNATQGLGFGSNSIYAAGTDPNHHLNLMPKGRDGGVGIGVTNPRAKLEVAGDIRLTGDNLVTGALGRITPLLVRGTGSNNNAPRALVLGSDTLYTQAQGLSRGLTLTVIRRSDHGTAATTTFDTYAYADQADTLATTLNAVTNDQIGILTSYDAWEGQITSALRTALRRLGLFKAAATSTALARRPYAAIFEASGGRGSTARAVEVLHGRETSMPSADIRGWLVDGSFVATGSAPNALADNMGQGPVVAVDESGKVGVGTTGPVATLDVQQSPRTGSHPSAIKGLYVTGEFGAASDGVEFRHSNATQGLGFGYNSIYAAGTNNAQHVNLMPKGTGGVGIGVTSPQAKLEVKGAGDMTVDLLVSGRLRSSSDDGGLWVAEDRFIGGHSTDQVGFYNNKAWRLTVLNNGNIGIGTTNPEGHRLSVRGGSTYLEGDLFVNGALKYWWGPDGVWKHVQNRGSDYAGSYSTDGPSDVRLKTALRPIGQALGKVLQLRGVRFRWADAGLRHLTRHIEDGLSAGPEATREQDERLWEAERRKAFEALSGDHIGLLAQDLEAVAPELVHQDEDGYKHVHYPQLAALLIEAIKEQNELLEAQSARIAALEAR